MIMKKFVFAFVLAFSGLIAANAQSNSAIGGRLGWGLEFSYLHSLGAANRLNLEVGLPGFYGVGAAGTYDWVFPINGWQEKGSWNWYAGVGAGFGFNWYHNWFNIGVAGRIGVEYNFWFPLQLSLDWRPVIGPAFGGGTHFNVGGLSDGSALGVRYILK